MKIACLAILLLLCSNATALECSDVEFESRDIRVCIDEQGALIDDADLWADDQTEWGWLGHSRAARRVLQLPDGRRFELGLRPDGIVVWKAYFGK